MLWQMHIGTGEKEKKKSIDLGSQGVSTTWQTHNYTLQVK